MSSSVHLHESILSGSKKCDVCVLLGEYARVKRLIPSVLSLAGQHADAQHGEELKESVRDLVLLYFMFQSSDLTLSTMIPGQILASALSSGMGC